MSTLTQLESKLARQIPQGRGVLVDRVYTKRDFLTALGLGDEAWRSMKLSGLKTALVGTKAIVRGEEFERWVREREK